MNLSEAVANFRSLEEIAKRHKIDPRKAKNLKDLIAEYGPLALGIYLITAVLVGIPALIAIVWGFEIESAGEKAASLGAVWVVLKVTQPFRIMATALLTPVVGKRWNPFKDLLKDPDDDAEEARSGEDPAPQPAES